MFLLRAAAIEHRGATSSSLLLRSWHSRPLAGCCDAAETRSPSAAGSAAATEDEAASFTPKSTGEGANIATTTRAFSANLVRRRLSSTAPILFSSSSSLSRRSFAADAARSLQDDAPSPSSSSSSSKKSNNNTKLVPIPLAQTGEGLKEVEIVAWRVAVGDSVAEFDPLLEVQSDKAAVEITSRFSGVVERLCFKEGDMVEVGATLCELRVEEEEEGEGGVEVEVVGNVSPVALSSLSASSSPSQSPSLASPAVRRVARELGFSSDLSSIRGTGPGGRVLKEDVERAAAVVGSSSSSAAALSAASASPAQSSTPSPSMPEPEAKKEAPLSSSSSTQKNNNDIIVPLRGYRRSMVSAMTASLNVPHFHFMDEYNVDKLMEARKALAGDPKLQGTKLTLLPFVLKAISLTLASSDQYAIVNASLSDSKDSIIIHADHNIGVAVDTPRGLVVPVVKRVQDLSVAEVAAELARLQNGLLSGGAGGLLPEVDLQGATLTVSNIGSLGGAWATPLLHPPQAAIVALGRVRPKLVLVEEEKRGGSDDEAKKSGNSRGSKKHSAAAASSRDNRRQPTPPTSPPSLSAVASLPMSWGADHRVVDGAGLARFAAAVGALLAEPARMLLHSR